MFVPVVKSDQNTGCLVELHYLPCIRYMALFYQYDNVTLERHEHYQKGSYRNRCYIGTAQGPQLLSVPLLKGKHQQLPVQDVQIAYHTSWHTQHWHAIHTAYGKAPFFIHYGDDLKDILYERAEKLYDLNITILKWFLHHLSAPAQIKESAQYLKIPGSNLDDLRNSILPESEYSSPQYPQAFMDRQEFLSNLSALDLLMHLGPQAYHYLQSMDTRNLL